jgi:hypothetical protein
MTGKPDPLSSMLRQEFEAIWGKRAADKLAQQTRKSGEPRTELDRRRAVFATAHALAPAAPSLSGGGVRSAFFALGVLQALAETRLLRRFDYLSTVSGGGYIGAWLTAWLSRSGTEEVLRQLEPARAGAQDESPAIRHLRDHGSYLTPVRGLMSPDFWTTIGIILRNLLLNWLILLPAICLPVLAIKITAALAHTATFKTWGPWPPAAVAVLGIALASLSLGYKLFKLYARQPEPDAATEQRRFLVFCLLPAIVAGACYAWLANAWLTPGGALLLPLEGDTAETVQALTDPPDGGRPWIMAVIGLLTFAIAGLGAAWRAELQGQALDKVAWVVAALISGSLVWLGVFVYQAQWPTKGAFDPQTFLVILGVPWLLLSLLIGQMVYVILRSYSEQGDFEREWLGRCCGWYLISAAGWAVLSGLVLLGSAVYDATREWISGAQIGLAGLGTLAGVVTAVLGSSRLTSATGRDGRHPFVNLGLAIAGPLFAAILLVFLSIAFDRVVLGMPFQDSAFFRTTADFTAPDYWQNWQWTLLLTAGLVAVMTAASLQVNVNHFSMHSLYRNRLIRAFLGASRPGRQPAGFTGFDRDDDASVASLWKGRKGSEWRPFPVINIALNLASSKKLAWQHRKAESFTVTPLHCGTAELGYRPSREYGGGRDGITLGTAMAISGAAVSPNMGYHSSPSVAFLLTLFNVRLGWWLGNPGIAGAHAGGTAVGWMKEHTTTRSDLDPYRQEAPWLALRPLFAELFGLTTEDSPYVYLSDGGHFENLGLYEMVRRRCRWIVVSDAGEDAERGFEDLGNAVRKIWIDLGIRITFDDTQLLESTGESDPAGTPSFAIGRIDYLGDEGRPSGRILYIKPVVSGREGAADIIAYKRAFGEFPNQSTLDQWFDEPQLESYRTLGYLIMRGIVDRAGGNAVQDLDMLFKGLAGAGAAKSRSRSRVTWIASPPDPQRRPAGAPGSEP